MDIDCQTIQKEATKEMRKVSKEMVDATEMELVKLATIECNKLNNTSFKIMQEMKTVETTHNKLKELHNHCAKMLDPMSRWSTQFITAAELDRKLELNSGQTASTIDSRMDHIQQLLHPLRNAIESLQQGVDPMVGQVQTLQANIDRIQNPPPTTSMSTDQILQKLHVLCQETQSNRATMAQQQQQIQRIQESYETCVPRTDHYNQIAELKRNMTELKQQVKDLKDKLEAMPSPVSPRRNPLFLQVDPTKIPSHGHSTNKSTTHANPPIPRVTCEATLNILPFGLRVTIQHAGTSVECWIHKCYQNWHGIKYEASRSNGEHITFTPESIINRDTNATPTKVPDNHIVDIPGGTAEQSNASAPSHVPSHAYPENNKYREYHSDGSETSNDNHDDYRYKSQNRKSSQRQLAHNAFIYPLGSLPQYIKEEKASTVGKTFHGHLKAHEDPRNFYQHVRTVVMIHKVLLRPYKTITKEYGLLEIKRWNCGNYETAQKLMSRFLYIFFFHGRDLMFDANQYTKHSLLTYETEQDGLGFLRNLIHNSHPELRATVHRSNITDAFQLPIFDDYISIWEYLNKMQIYFREVNTKVPQVDILRLIHDQLRMEPWFTTATEHIESKIKDHKTGNGFVPPEFHVNNIAWTDMDMYDMKQHETLSEPQREKITALDVPIIHQIQSHNGARGSAPQPQGSRPLASYSDNHMDRQDTSSTGMHRPLASYGGQSDQQKVSEEKIIS